MKLKITKAALLEHGGEIAAYFMATGKTVAMGEVIDLAAGGGATPTLHLSGIVGSDIAPSNVKQFLDANAAMPVTLHLNSPGGSVFDGLEIYNSIRSHGQVDLVVDGLAASAASLVAMGAKTVTMQPGALMMVHNASAMTIGNAATHRQSAGVLDKVDEQVTGIYAARSGMAPKRVAALLAAETWLDGPEAVDAGLADHAVPARTETNDAPARASLNFNVDIRNFYKNPPAALFAMLGNPPETPMPELNPKPAVDVTADILNRAAAAKLSAADTVGIVAKAAGNVDTARDLITAAVVAKSSDQRHTPAVVVGAAGGDEDGHAKLIGENLRAKLEGKLAPATNPFRGMGTVALATEFMRARGIRPASNDATSIIRQVMQPTMSAGENSTSDFPVILGDQMHKILQDLYTAADTGVSQIAGTGVLVDYRPQSQGKLDAFPSFEAVAEGAEITHGTLAEGGEKITVANFARAINVSINVLINDNLGAVMRSIQDVAFAAVNLKASLIINALLTATMADGKTLFDAAHGNTSNYGAIGLTALSAMRKAMRTQTALDGVSVLGLTPSVLLVPAALETTAQQIAHQIAAVVATEVNPFGGNISVAVEPRLDALSTTDFYAFSNPAQMAAVKFATLDATLSPRLEMAPAWETLGNRYRCWWAVGAAPMEHRAAVQSTGA